MVISHVLNPSATTYTKNPQNFHPILQFLHPTQLNKQTNTSPKRECLHALGTTGYFTTMKTLSP
jgi:hypothetical protein